jgi:hypothetical protein
MQPKLTAEETHLLRQLTERDLRSSAAWRGPRLQMGCKHSDTSGSSLSIRRTRLHHHSARTRRALAAIDGGL